MSISTFSIESKSAIRRFPISYYSYRICPRCTTTALALKPIPILIYQTKKKRLDYLPTDTMMFENACIITMNFDVYNGPRKYDTCVTRHMLIE